MHLTYRTEGDYLIPNLTLPAEETVPLGKYGLLRQRAEGASGRTDGGTAKHDGTTQIHRSGEVDRADEQHPAGGSRTNLRIACGGWHFATHLLFLAPMLIHMILVLARRTTKLRICPVAYKYHFALLAQTERTLLIRQHETEHHLNAQRQ